MAIEIETSSDTPEQVKAALAKTVEIDETPAAKEEEPADKAKTPKTEAAKEEPAEEEAEESEEDEESTEEPEEKPKPKAGKAASEDMVPRNRLNEEIRKRKAAETRLAEASAPAPRREAVEEEPAAAKTPQNYCGRPKPTLNDFLRDTEKYPDPHEAHADAVGEWYADERDAKRDFEARVAEVARITEERTEAFRKAIPAALERHPDYNAVVKGSGVIISERMETFAYESEVGPDILYHLSLQPEEAERIRSIRTNRGQDKAMEELEQKLLAEIKETDEEAEEKPASKTPKAGAPKKPEGSTKSTVSGAPTPPARIKSNGPQPKTQRELAGPEDRAGVDIDYSPEFEKGARARRSKA